jgi:hypothetical protein
VGFVMVIHDTCLKNYCSRARRGEEWSKSWNPGLYFSPAKRPESFDLLSA